LELEELPLLRLPCILHWDLNHFVVLVKATRKGIVILDPAVGRRSLGLQEVSRHFTGVALELTPTERFRPQDTSPRIGISELTGTVTGLRRSLLQIFLLALALEAFAITAPFMNQLIIDDVLVSGDHNLLTIVIAGFGLLLVCQTLIGLARSWAVIVLGQSLALQWMGNVFAHLLRLPVAFFEKRHLGDITSRFGSIAAIQRVVTTAAVEALLDGIMASAALVLMFVYSPSLASVVLAAVAAYALLRWASYRPFRDAAAERLVLAARENTCFLETLRAITPLKLFGREHERLAKWQNLVVEVENRDLRTARMSMAFATANGFIFGVENLLVFWLGASMIMDGQQGGAVAFTVGMLFAFIAYKGQFTGRVSRLIDFLVEARMLTLHAERLADIVLEPPEPDDIPDNELAHLQPSIELRDVSFRYSPGEPWILRNANLRVEAGQSVAITGPSGAGKTTALKIALGLLEPSEGEVLFGGLPIRQVGLRNYRRQVGTVMQEDTLLSGSLADNISLFDTQIDLAGVEACARLAEIHDDIVRMPMGYQSLVGDLGSGLSGGQKQRLLLARALYKRPRVLALDEATSHLDLVNERAVVARMGQLQLTRLVIAHRPDTLAAAERLIVIQAGQLTEITREPPSPKPDAAPAADAPVRPAHGSP
ncbi:MAG: peptidase domain-containing ABC transporter, partial [Proteobacteria bacterium]|nr:peptidase domain-containing ABC transporter [Pseudomonadota bacterium]